MFAGLEDVDWASMHHAYGPATDVPDLLRGLLADNAEAREIALDGLYGAVHHQGDIYDCTIACVPFLLQAVADARVLDRGGILGLLASIGGADIDDEDDDADIAEQDASSWFWNSRVAHETVLACWPTFLGLLADPDPQVRREAPRALLACWEQAAAILRSLQERLAVEPDPQARVAIVETVGALGVRAATGRAAGVDSGAVGSWLGGVAADAADPTVRLAALTQLARCAPDALPSDVVSTVLGVIGEVYGDDQVPGAGTAPAATGVTAEPASPAGGTAPSTPTLIGALRQLRERNDAGRRAPLTRDVLHSLHRALGDRVPERIELLGALLRAPDWERRIDAVRSAALLIQGWRGRYQELVAWVGEQLADPEPRLCEAAASALEDLYELAAPAADALVRCLDAAPRESRPASQGGLPPAWVTVWPRDLPSTGPVLKALARLGDRRALPAVRWTLERREPPGDIGFVIAPLGALAADLVPLIGRRLGDLPIVDGYDRRRGGLVAALGGLGDAAAPAVPDLLALLGHEQIGTGVIRALGRLGATAAEAAPALRGRLDHADPETALAAASALWRVARDPAPCLPVFQRHLAPGGTRIATAAEGVAELGPAAAPAARRLRELLADPSAWVRLHAAEALWQAAGDTEATLPVLLAVWDDNVHVRVHVTRCVGEMGAPAGVAVPVLHRELAQVRRHNHHYHGSDAVRADEALLQACSQALNRITGSASGDPIPIAK